MLTWKVGGGGGAGGVMLAHGLITSTSIILISVPRSLKFIR